MNNHLSQFSAKMRTPERKSRLTCSLQISSLHKEQKQGMAPNLFSDTTDLACHICSRIPKANHDHSLLHKIVLVLGFPAVELSALEVSDSCERRVKSPESQAEAANTWANCLPKL